MTDPITPATIARLRELDAAATPVPWAASEWYCNDSEGGWAAIGPHHLAETDDIDDGPDGQLHKAAKADAALIAAMRNALPALLDQLDAQAAEIDLLRRQTEELEKWKGLALVAEEVTDARIADLLENDAKATGHSFSDAAAVFQRKATRLQRELDVIRASRDDLEDERHRLAVKAEGYQSRVAELEGLLRESAWDANDINGLPQDEYNCLLRRIAAALAGRESGQ